VIALRLYLQPLLSLSRLVVGVSPASNVCLFTILYCMVYCSFILNLWNVCLTRIDNGQLAKSEGVAGEDPEQ
jgi:hypothetical protein